MTTTLELLDYCILTYQLHAQTFLCAPDPYGEQMMSQGEVGAGRGRRYRFLDAMEFTLDRQTAPNNPLIRGRVAEYANVKGFNPGGQPYQDNRARIAPIGAKYDRISPHFAGFVRPALEEGLPIFGTEKWIRYQAPQSLTERIGHWETHAYATRMRCPANPNAQVLRIPSTLSPALPHPQGLPRQDRLYCFEGGTGICPNTNSTGVWSLMGFVLARMRPNPPAYDLIVAFRGSRSGRLSVPRLAALMASGVDPNPDWKTNLHNEYAIVQEIADVAAPAAGPATVHQGFASALTTMLPTIRSCVNQARLDMGRGPTAIYITGHSLGGALASCFHCANVLGTGPTFGMASNIPANQLRVWAQSKLVTFAAPKVASESVKRRYEAIAWGKAYRLEEDKVPKGGNGFVLGQDNLLLGDFDSMTAHSPESIRFGLKVLLNLQDNEHPWTEQLDIMDVVNAVRTYAQATPMPAAAANPPLPGSQLPYRFRDGLVTYLLAFAYMKQATNPALFRLSAPERTDIVTFLDDVCQPVSALGVPVDPTGAPAPVTDNWQQVAGGLPPQLDTRFNSIAAIPSVVNQRGMIRMLKHWLSLIMVQAGGTIPVQNPPAWFDLT